MLLSKLLFIIKLDSHKATNANILQFTTFRNVQMKPLRKTVISLVFLQ